MDFLKDLKQPHWRASILSLSTHSSLLVSFEKWFRSIVLSFQNLNWCLFNKINNFLENAAKCLLRRIHALDILIYHLQSFSLARLSAPTAFVLYALDRVGDQRVRERDVKLKMSSVSFSHVIPTVFSTAPCPVRNQTFVHSNPRPRGGLYRFIYKISFYFWGILY